MGAVAVAQHLHAMAVVLTYNDVPRAIKRYAPGSIELPVPCSMAADAAQVRPVAVPKDLNAMVETIAHHQVALAIKRNAAIGTVTVKLVRVYITSSSLSVAIHLNAMLVKIRKIQIARGITNQAANWMINHIKHLTKLPITIAVDDAHAACTRSCNRPQPPRQFVAPRQNAGGFPPRIPHGALASETQQPHGKRHAQAAAGDQTLPLLDPKMGAECATLCGRDTEERWAPAEDGLQLPLAASERP